MFSIPDQNKKIKKNLKHNQSTLYPAASLQSCLICHWITVAGELGHAFPSTEHEREAKREEQCCLLSVKIVDIVRKNCIPVLFLHGKLSYIKGLELIFYSPLSYPPSDFCLYPYLNLSSNFSIVFLFLSIFNLYLSSLSFSYTPCQYTSPVNGHNHVSLGWSSSSAASARSSSILFNSVKSKNLAHIYSFRCSTGCCSSNEPVWGSMYIIFRALW